jgi:rare lipoprotein A
MAEKNVVKRAIFWPALFLCILFILSVSASVGYQVADTIYSRYSEIICMDTADFSSSPRFVPSGTWPEIGRPFPQSTRSRRPRVIGEVTASWYGSAHHKKLTASGQRFDMHKNTLAHRTLPLGTKVRLINRDNGKSAVGVVNDRGPYIAGRDVDVSYAIAEQLGFIKKGIMKLFIEPIWTIDETNPEG